jgi:hypothetical protein
MSARHRRIAGVAPLTLAGLVLFAHATTLAAEPDWPYERDLRNRLLLLHPLLNYAVHPDQRAAWERERVAGSAMLATIGSVHTEELLIDAQWALNADLAPGLRLRNDVVWLETRHLPFARRDTWLGFEGTVSAGLAGVVQVQPAYDKEDLDLRFGVLWTADADRSRYVQLLYVREDLVYGQKNALGGAVEQPAAGIDWLVRQELGRWTLTSQGRWRQRFVRSFPDSAQSPDLAGATGRDDALSVRVTYAAGPRASVEAALELNETAAAETRRANLYSHDYTGRLQHLALSGLVPLDDHWRLRGELHRAAQRADATGWQAFGYRRQETMAALFGEWRWHGRHQLEAGYLNTWYDWRYAGEPTTCGRADKISLAVQLGFVAEATLRLSVNHEVNLQRFGGFNVQIYAPF